MEVVQSSVAVGKEGLQAKEDREEDIKEQANNHKVEVAISITTTEVEEEAEEVEDSAGGIMISHNGTEIPQSIFDRTGR